MHLWRNVRNSINDLIMQHTNVNSLCACTPDELKPPQHYHYRVMINKSTSGTYMGRLTALPCNSLEGPGPG
jgi:phosphodiesterase/alkaline phosphatase D-like protein